MIKLGGEASLENGMVTDITNQPDLMTGEDLLIKDQLDFIQKLIVDLDKTSTTLISE